jgi:uncharacterized protein (DUF488 family)
MVIYTIGHSNQDQGDLIGLLGEQGIETLVDVRSSPYSRYAPHFNRESLGPALEHADIEYVFAGEYLGGRPTDPSCYKNGIVPPAQADFLKLVDYAAVATRPWFIEEIDRLLEIAGDKRTAIMCSEEDPAQCHRHHLIAQSLLERGVEVQHIRKTGAIEEAERIVAPEPVPTQTSFI